MGSAMGPVGAAGDEGLSPNFDLHHFDPTATDSDDEPLSDLEEETQQ